MKPHHSRARGKGVGWLCLLWLFVLVCNGFRMPRWMLKGLCLTVCDVFSALAGMRRGTRTSPPTSPPASVARKATQWSLASAGEQGETDCNLGEEGGGHGEQGGLSKSVMQAQCSKYLGRGRHQARGGGVALCLDPFDGVLRVSSPPVVATSQMCVCLIIQED